MADSVEGIPELEPEVSGENERPLDPPEKEGNPPPDAIIKDPEIGPGAPPPIKEPNPAGAGPGKTADEIPKVGSRDAPGG